MYKFKTVHQKSMTPNDIISSSQKQIFHINKQSRDILSLFIFLISVTIVPSPRASIKYNKPTLLLNATYKWEY